MNVEERRNENGRLADGGGLDGRGRGSKSEPKAKQGAGRSKRAKRHAMIMRGIVTPILGLLAVAAVGVGILNATIWQPDRVITADAKTSGTRYVVTDPDVLGLVDDEVTMKVRSDAGGDVCVAFTTSKDAAGWLAGETYTRLTGLADWTTVSGEKATGQARTTAAGVALDPGPDVAFKDSDMWRDVQCGQGSVSLKAKTTAVTDVALVDLGAKGAADVSFTWTRSTLPDYATPMYFIGGLLAVMAVLTATVFAMPPHKRRNTKRVVESDPVEADEVSIGEAVAGTFGISAGGPSRRASTGGRRRRHAVGSDTGTIEPVQAAQPVVVDPSARNLVADAAGTGSVAGAGGADATDAPNSDDEATSVITPDEFQAYFARLAAESGVGLAGTGLAGTEPAGTQDGDADDGGKDVDKEGSR